MTNYYIAVLDILGFKKLILNTQLDKIIRMVESLLPQILVLSTSLGDIWKKSNGTYFVKEYNGPLNYAMLSDTVIFFVEDNPNSDKESSNFMSLVWSLPLALALGFSAKLPFRGAVAYGEFYCNSRRSVLLGRSLVEAYEYGQKQEWSGICFCPSVVNEMTIRGVDILKIPCITKYNVPFKCGVQEVPTINWTPLIVNPRALGSVFMHTSGEVEAKARNTIDYYRYCEENNLSRAYKYGRGVEIELEEG